MLDIRFIRENPELVRENIRKKFQDKKLPLVDEVLELDEKLRAAKTEANELRANRNTLSKKIGMLMGQAKKDPSKLEEAEDVKAEVAREAARLAELEKLEPEYEAELTKRMMVIPQMIDPSVPIGPDDSCNVEVQRFGEANVPDFEIPYHTEIMESFNGVDLDAGGLTNGVKLHLWDVASSTNCGWYFNAHANGDGNMTGFEDDILIFEEQTPGTYTHYFKATYSNGDEVNVPVVLHVLDVKDDTYVLDYGLPVNLNNANDGGLTLNDPIRPTGIEINTLIEGLVSGEAYNGLKQLSKDGKLTTKTNGVSGNTNIIKAEVI